MTRQHKIIIGVIIAIVVIGGIAYMMKKKKEENRSHSATEAALKSALTMHLRYGVF